MKTFEEIYNTRPDKAEIGSSGYSNLKNLYNICERLQPELIVESGTWKGNSSWLFSHFAHVMCFDIDFSNLLWQSKDIDKLRYFLIDIESSPLDMVEQAQLNTLFYFDDHISHLQRLKWLISIGAKYAVFDDNHPANVTKNLKNPPSPTLQEMWDVWDLNPISFLEIKHIKKYEILPFHGNKRNFDTRLTYIEL